MKTRQPLKIGKKHRREIADALSLLTQLGLTMVASVLVGVMAGKFLDSKFGTSPWFLLVFTVLGAAAAIKSMYGAAMKNMRNMEKDDGER